MPNPGKRSRVENPGSLDKIKRDGIFEVYEELKGRIVRRELLPDIKINQNLIAKELNVSRTPVIKALHMLKSEGLVDNIPNKGFYVHKATLKDTVELYELRQIVEMVAASNTAEYASLDEIRELGNIFTPFIKSEQIDQGEYEEADRQFHSRLIELSQNSMLQRTNQSILLLPKAFTSGLLRNPRITLHEHLDIVDALMRRDAKQSQLLAQKHLELTIESLKNAIEGIKKIGMDPNKIAVTDIEINRYN